MGWNLLPNRAIRLMVRDLVMIRSFLTLIALLAAALSLGVGTTAALSLVRAAPAAPPAAEPAPTATPAPAPAEIVAPTQAATPAPVPTPQPAPAADEPFVIKRILDIGGPIRFGDYYWNDEGVPPGPVVITVDIEAQTLSVFRGGYEIGATAILYGDEDKPTPLGTFPITQKKKHHISNLYGAPMPYMQRLTNDGISIHGSEVEWGYATHGCIGVPTAFARLLFGVTSLGDEVIVTRGKRIGVGDAITG